MSEPTSTQAERTPETDETVPNLYRFLSGVLADPPCEKAVREFQAGLVPQPRELPTEQLQRGFHTIGAWASKIEDVEATATALKREHTRLFVGPRPRLQVHESYYAGDYLGTPLVELKRTYAKLGIQPGEDHKEEADHAAVELAALAWLSETATDRRGPKRTFLREHGAWFTSLAEDIRREAESPFYRGIGDILAGLVRYDRDRLDIDLEPPVD
ncbi:MAG: TorD/DmsD family molecular chaperone [Halodesulfurarchaeum sp.]